MKPVSQFGRNQTINSMIHYTLTWVYACFVYEERLCNRFRNASYKKFNCGSEPVGVGLGCFVERASQPDP